MLKYSDKKYDDIAAEYDQKWPKYLDVTHQKAVELLAPQSGETILDAAAGTGALTQRILSAVGESGTVYLAEISPGMRAVARERFHRHPNIHVDSADVHELGYEDNMFDRIVCANSFHYFEDPEQVLLEFRRVLKPKGRLVIVDWSNDQAYFRLYDYCLRFLSEFHQKTYTSEELETYLEDAGFDIEKTESWRYRLWSLMGVSATATDK